MATRARHEYQIKLNSYNHNGRNTFEDALLSALYPRGMRDLSRLPDDLIEEVRAIMIGQEWFRHKLNRENRKRAAYLAALESRQTKETIL